MYFVGGFVDVLPVAMLLFPFGGSRLAVAS